MTVIVKYYWLFLIIGTMTALFTSHTQEDRNGENVDRMEGGTQGGVSGTVCSTIVRCENVLLGCELILVNDPPENSGLRVT